jgi:methionyl-tRNA formyltransferase
VAQCDGRRLAVATGQGLILFERVQPEGKRIMAIADFLRGHPIQIGDALPGNA